MEKEHVRQLRSLRLEIDQEWDRYCGISDRIMKQFPDYRERERVYYRKGSQGLYCPQHEIDVARDRVFELEVRYKELVLRYRFTGRGICHRHFARSGYCDGKYVNGEFIECAGHADPEIRELQREYQELDDSLSGCERCCGGGDEDLAELSGKIYRAIERYNAIWRAIDRYEAG